MRTAAEAPFLESEVVADQWTPSVKADPMPPMPRYLRLRELQTIVPFSVPTIWRKSKNGTFVKPIKLSARVTAWNREAVEAWLAAKEAA